MCLTDESMLLASKIEEKCHSLFQPVNHGTQLKVLPLSIPRDIGEEKRDAFSGTSKIVKDASHLQTLKKVCLSTKLVLIH
jgi:hypothetical protein